MAIHGSKLAHRGMRLEARKQKEVIPMKTKMNWLLGRFASRLPAITENNARLNRDRRTNNRSSRRLLLESLECRKVFDAGWATSIAGLVSDTAGDISGNHYLTGPLYSASSSTFGNTVLQANSFGNLYVAKQDSSGQFLWAVRAGNPGVSNEASRSIVVDAGGNIYFAGYFDGTAQFGPNISLTSAGDTDGFVAKIDGATGQFLWARQTGGSLSDVNRAVTVDPSGNVIVTSSIGMLASSSVVASELSITKFDTNGTTQWTKSVSGETSGLLLHLESDATGAIYVGGVFKGTANFQNFPSGTLVNDSPDFDGVVAKLDSDGNWLWTKALSGDSAFGLSDMIIGPDQQLYVSSLFEGTANLDGNTIVSKGKTDFLIAKVDSATSNVSWAQRMGGTDRESTGGQLAFDPQGNLNIAGTFRGTADFGSQSLTADGVRGNAFLSKLTTNGSFVDSHRVVTGTFSGGIDIDVLVGGLEIDALGNTYVGGWFNGGQVQAPQQSLNPNYTGGSAGFIIKLPPSAPTKFFVIDDAANDRTYQYASSGDLTIDDFRLNNGNTAPRGAVSNATGSTVWVADKNRNVYVYSNSGALQGSWTASSLSSTAVVEGVATNGTDFWIVDNKTDKVFRHTGAASRISGSQSAASSFVLNNANTNPKGIVTDGTYVWVLNDSSTDKIFKYTVSGSYLGSWAIDTANKSPTGLTIDPTNGSQDIWVVDNGTDKIYQYANSRSRTSGSQVASATYGLAVGNTNPQGIADPPPASSKLTNSNTMLANNYHAMVEDLGLSVGPVPMLSYETTITNVASASSRQVETKFGSTDAFMSALGRSIPLPQAAATIARTSPIVSRESKDPCESDEFESVSDDIDDLVGLVAKNC